jgi:hypothetical protein
MPDILPGYRHPTLITLKTCIEQTGKSYLHTIAMTANHPTKPPLCTTKNDLQIFDGADFITGRIKNYQGTF